MLRLQNLDVEKEPEIGTLARGIPVDCRLVVDKIVSDDVFRGEILGLSKKSAELALDRPVEILLNIRLNLTRLGEELATRNVYAKVIRRTGDDAPRYVIHFTSIPPEIAAYLAAHREFAGVPGQEESGRRASAE